MSHGRHDSSEKVRIVAVIVEPLSRACRVNVLPLSCLHGTSVMLASGNDVLQPLVMISLSQCPLYA